MINLIAPPTGGAPLTTDDYNAQNVLMNNVLKLATNNQRWLTEWETSFVPQIPNGLVLQHGGAAYLADSDTAILGSPSDGSVWIKVSGTDTLSAEFINSIAGFTWSGIYNGFYNVGGDQLLPVKMLKDSTEYRAKVFLDLKNNEEVGIFSDGKGDRGNGVINGTYTEDQLFTLFKDLIPVVGKVYRLISGGMRTSPKQIAINVNFIKRVSSTQINFEGFQITYTGGNQIPDVVSQIDPNGALSVTSGSGTNKVVNISWG